MRGFAWTMKAGFQPLDAKLATSLSAVVAGDRLRAISCTKEHVTLEGKPMKGRLVLYEAYNASAPQRERAATSNWEFALGAMHMMSPYTLLGSLFYQHAHRSQSLRDQIARYARLLFGHADRNFNFLASTVRKSTLR